MNETPDRFPHLDRHSLQAVDRFTTWGLSRYEAGRVLETISSMDEFNERWLRAAARWERMARDGLAAGRKATAYEWFLQAMWHYRVADFHELATVLGEWDNEPYLGARRCFDEAVQLLDLDYSSITIADGSHEYPGYVVRPAGNASSDAPGVVFIYGADGIKEDHLWGSVLPLLARGVAVLVGDGPGQGSSLRLDRIPARADFEVYGAAARKTLAAVDGVDPDRIAVFGSSMAGYYGARCFAQDEAFVSCCLNSACWDVHEALWNHYPPIRTQLINNVCATSDEEADRLYQDFNLEAVEANLNRPIAIFHGELDGIMPAADAERLSKRCHGPTELHIWPGAQHNMFNVVVEAHPQMWDWIAESLDIRS